MCVQLGYAYVLTYFACQVEQLGMWMKDLVSYFIKKPCQENSNEKGLQEYQISCPNIWPKESNTTELIYTVLHT